MAGTAAYPGELPVLPYRPRGAPGAEWPSRFHDNRRVEAFSVGNSSEVNATMKRNLFRTHYLAERYLETMQHSRSKAATRAYRRWSRRRKATKSRTNVIDISTGRGFQRVEQTSIEALEHALFLRYLRRCQMPQTQQPWECDHSRTWISE
jgi:hypothetical protein